jgi:curved DNA-binding protein CbpA
MSTLYEALGIQPTANGEAIQRAFYDLARAYHPDRRTTDDASHERFKQVTAAYAVLKNAAARATYDAELEMLRRVRRQRKRELLICALAAALSFSVVSGGILLFRDARAAQQLALWQPPAPQVAQAPPQSEAPLRKLPSLSEFIAPVEDSIASVPADAMVTGSTQGQPAAPVALPPTEDAADRARPTEDLKTASATTPALTAVVRVWTRPPGTGRGAQSGHAVKTFTVPRERPEDPRPGKEGGSTGSLDASKTARVLFP